MAKPSSMLARRDAQLNAVWRRKLDISLQMCLDAALIVANEQLHLGPTRAPAFADEFKRTVNKMADMLVVDSKDDPDLVYSRDQIDKRILQVVGKENYKNWKERYKE